jgi:GNAT superfamily N-acetyltransferase
MTSLSIVPLQEDHLPDAAALVTTRYRVLRLQVSPLPPRYEEVATILPLLRDLAAQTPGVVALRGGRIAGFLLALLLPSWRGKRSTYSPEWANAAVKEGSGQIYRQMYARLAGRWVANGCFTHLLTLLAHDREALDAWHWLGFGLVSVDAIRDLSPVERPPIQVDVSRAGLQDVEAVMKLDLALNRYMASPPIFLPLVKVEGRAFHEERLADPASALWLAHRDGEARGYMTIGPANPNACAIIDEAKTASIVGAFVDEGLRGRGMGSALLSHSLDWARETGYERCAVDFEPENIPGSRFWLRYFQPICYSMIRRVDEQIAWAHQDRDEQDL